MSQQPTAGKREPKNHLAVALDTADWSTFERWCALFGPRVGCLKVGLEAYVRWGPKAVDTALAAGGRVFLDLKLHDIPNTVAGAVASVRSLGVHFITVHAGGGSAQLRAAVQAAGDDLEILAVTVLTSLDDDALTELSMPGSAPARVIQWAQMAQRAGCGGIVSSALEASALRQSLGNTIRLVTPGIRLADGAQGDQKRVATPASAIRDGADLLVVGRPLTQAADQVAAVDRFLEQIAVAQDAD